MEMLRNLRVSHQARQEDGERVARFYAEHGIDAEVAPFFRDLPRRMSEAQLVISRAGASSLADIAVIGRPSILIPYPHAAGDHQSANARMLAEAGAAVVMSEGVLDIDSLSAEIAAILSDPKRALAMSRAAMSVARPAAAEALADLVEALADGRGGQTQAQADREKAP